MVRKGKLTKKARKDKERHERELEDGRRANGQRVLIVCKNNSLELNFSVEIPFVTQKIERKGNKTEIRNPLSSHPPNITAATGHWTQTLAKTVILHVLPTGFTPSEHCDLGIC